jgi:DNA-binding NtrC family response regulator
MSAILLVDDDSVFRSLMGLFLENAGYKCAEAEDVPHARAWLGSRRFDLIISDFNMPRGSGLDLLRYVVSDHPETPFIMLTGEDSPAVRRKALTLGACEFISKPFRLNDLLKSVDRAMLHSCPASGSAIAMYAQSPAGVALSGA